MTAITAEARVRYRLGEARAARLLRVLDANAVTLDLEGHNEQRFEVADSTGEPRSRVTLRFTVGQEFGELELVDGEEQRASANVYAAGPIERILSALGFREVGRSVVLRRRYRFQGALVCIAHDTASGWSCEIVSRQADAHGVVSALVDAERSAAFDSTSGAAALVDDRRRGERRSGERRRRYSSDGRHRRLGSDRRFGDRRLSSGT